MQESYVIYRRNVSFLLLKLNFHLLANLLPVLCFICQLFYIEQIQHLREEFKKERGAVILPQG